MGQRYTPTQVNPLHSAHFPGLHSQFCSFTEFVSPAAVRSALKREKGDKYGQRKHAEQERAEREAVRKLEEDQLAVAKVFS